MASALSSCVSSLRSTNQLLSSSISILDSGVNDFPRLAKVLQTTRHFELLPESSIQSAQRDLLASLTPEVNSLLARCELHLDRLERREQALIARCELLEGRLSSSGEEARRASSLSGGKSRASESGESNEREVLRLKQMRAKKERLQYAVERLELQAKQRQRQLRMSIAAQPGAGVD
ncbi:MAG: hypothetical protein Q9195_002705 [Heterodermia aff. obscurata]